MTARIAQLLILATNALPGSSFSPSVYSSVSSSRPKLQMVHTLRDADFYEMLVGGERYEMVPLPDSMLDTTLFVGNLNEFANDQDLSDFFCRVTELLSVPACVARKANMASLEYGFVTFPTMQEKERAIMKFHNSQFMGKHLKVEEIRDHPKRGRVRVPERMVAYVIGGVKKTSSREINTMRRVSNPKTNPRKKKTKRQQLPKQRKLKNYKLADKEQEGLQRAVRNGFVTLDGTGFRRGRKTSNLACAHRQWCDAAVSKPQIVLCKASGGRPLDCVIVDLSPLRMIDGYAEWNGQIEEAALRAGMTLRLDYVEDNCQQELAEKQQELPISNLPAISMGVFEGERSQARAMARELASVWDLPSEQEMSQEPNARKPRSNDKRKKRRNERKQELDFFF